LYIILFEADLAVPVNKTPGSFIKRTRNNAGGKKEAVRLVISVAEGGIVGAGVGVGTLAGAEARGSGSANEGMKWPWVR